MAGTLVPAVYQLCTRCCKSQ